MAKRSGARQRRPARQRLIAGADPAARRDTIEGLRYCHAKGQELLEEFPVGAKVGEPWPKRPQYHTGGQLDARAEEEGITRQELLLRRRFAFLYSDADLERLCAYQPPLSWSAVRWLLRVRNREEREKLERDAHQKGWTAAELKEKILRRKDTLHHGGRHLKQFRTLEAGLDATAEAIGRLEGMLEQVLTGEAALAQKRMPSSEAARKRRQDLIAAAETAMAALDVFREQLGEKRRFRKRATAANEGHSEGSSARGNGRRRGGRRAP